MKSSFLISKLRDVNGVRASLPLLRRQSLTTHLCCANSSDFSHPRPVRMGQQEERETLALRRQQGVQPRI